MTRSYPVAVGRVRVCPADVGRRVSVRHRDPADARLTDVVGHLVSWAGGELVVRRRNGTSVTAHEDAVVAAKVVPPDVSAYVVQELADTGWPSQDREQVGSWLLRWDHDVTRRANAALVSTPVPDLPAQLGLVQAWYAARGSRPALQIPEPWPGEAALARLGWVRGVAADVLTVPAADLADRLRGTVGPQIRLHDHPDPGWLAEVEGIADQQRRVLAAILSRSPTRVFATARVGNQVLGIGRASLDHRDGLRWCCLTNLNTAPHARRRGVALAVVAALADWALTQGATTAYLQVEADNGPARSLYERLGFTTHHRYVYWWAPA